MTKVLQPLNEKAAQIATDNIDLLEGSTIEPLLLQVRMRGEFLSRPPASTDSLIHCYQLVAHVYANRVILERLVRVEAMMD